MQRFVRFLAIARNDKKRIFFICLNSSSKQHCDYIFTLFEIPLLIVQVF
jgi:hypothetical protein